MGVLTLRGTLHCSLAPFDTGIGLNRHRLRELGIGEVTAHRLGMSPTCDEDLMWTDVLAAPSSVDLIRHPTQSLTAVEVDHRSQMTAVQQLERRIASAERLGLRIGRGIVVAAEEKRSTFERRLRSVPAHVRDRMEFWSMAGLFAAYEQIRSGYLRTVAAVNRARISRAA
jgi:hypothetical protein